MIEKQNADNGGKKEDLFSIINMFFFELCVFSIIFSILFYILYWGFILTHWQEVVFFFSYFESYSAISTMLVNAGISIFNNPSLQSISVVIVLGVAFFYVTQMIRDQGYLFYESEGIEGKYFKSLFIFLATTMSIFLPYLYYLWINQKNFEFAIVVFALFFNFLVGMILFNLYAGILKDFDKLSELKTSILTSKKFSLRQGNYSDFLKFYAFRNRSQMANTILLIMFLCLFFCFVMKFNLISIIFIEISLFIEYFIFCSVTRMPDGPVNIFLKGSGTIFRDAYIYEESSKGYVFIVLKNENLKKIMTSSILYMEPIDRNWKDPILESFKRHD